MERWIAAHPTDANAGRGLIWMAELRLSDNQVDEALQTFERVEREYANTEWGWHGARGRADLEVALHRYSRALETYAQLERLSQPYWQYIGRRARLETEAERRRYYLSLALLLGLVVLGGYRLARAKDRLGAVELWGAAPVVLVVTLAGWGLQPGERGAVLSVVWAGFALLWASGAYWQGRAASRGRVALEVLLGLGQAAAVLYVSVVLNGLWGRFFETLVNADARGRIIPGGAVEEHGRVRRMNHLHREHHHVSCAPVGHLRLHPRRADGIAGAGHVLHHDGLADHG